MGTWPIYKKTLPTTDLTKKPFHLIKYLLATFIFFLSFQSVLVYVGGWRCAATRIHYRNYFAHKLCWFVVISSYICKLTVRFVRFVVFMMSVVHLIWVSCHDIEVDFTYEFVAIVATVVLEAVLVRCSLVPTGTFNQKHETNNNPQQKLKQNMHISNSGVLYFWTVS